MTRLLGLVGSPTAPSKTRSAVEVALESAQEKGVETEIVHLAEFDLERADGRHIEEYEGDTAAVLDAVIQADAYVVGTPVYRGSLPGSFKNLFDMVPRGMWQGDVAPFENAAVGLVATGATPHHYLSIDQELRPLFAFFGSQTLGGSVYASDDHFDEKEIADADLRTRLATLGRATVELHRGIRESEALEELGPQF